MIQPLRYTIFIVMTFKMENRYFRQTCYSKESRY